MLTYIVRRLLIGVLTLLMITFVVYGLIRAMPGDPLLAAMERMDPSRKLNTEDIERLRKAYGLDKPWHEAYLVWLTDLARGDLSTSLSRKQPVATIIADRVGPTLLLSLSSLTLAYLLSIPLGIFAAARNGRWDERALSFSLYMLYSFPVFVAALLLQSYLAVELEIAPLFGLKSDNYAELSFLGKVGDVLWHSLLPVTCYTYGSLAYECRFIRSNMLEVVRQDYIRTARAKGASETSVYVRHAFRNTLIPFVTLIGLTLPTLLSGSVILEEIFNWPGMGRLFFESIRERDYPTIMGLTLIFSVLTLLGTLLADILYAVVDPRIHYS